MTVQMPDVAQTRRELRDAYLEALRALVEDATREVPSGEWEGVPVLTRKDLDEAIAAVFGVPVPAPDETWAEVRTPATVIVSAICPKCSVPTAISVHMHPELVVDDTGAEIRVKGKSKARAHVCGQLPLPETAPAEADGQQAFDLDDLVGERCGEPLEGADPCSLPAGHEGGHLWGVEALEIASDDVATCRVCGCTDEAACEGGCSWVEDPEQLGDLCSACLPQPDDEP